MCTAGDIILVESYKHRAHSLTRHSFVLKGFIMTLFAMFFPHLRMSTKELKS